MTELDEQDDALADDPVYGEVLANYPSDRGRLLLIGGAIYFSIGFVVNAAFARVDAATASIVVIGSMSALALVIGWFILHLWNREVILYARGFSYREGSRLVFFLYHEVRSVHYQAERVRYFGGLVRRIVRQLTIKTIADETLVLDSVYRRIDELAARLEGRVNAVLRPLIEERLGRGENVPFGDSLLLLTPGGIAFGERKLLWEDYTGYTIGGGKLTLHQADEVWESVALTALTNPTLLLDILQAHQP